MGKVRSLEKEMVIQKQLSIEKNENINNKLETHVIGSMVNNCILESRFEMLEKVSEEQISSFEDKLKMHEQIFEEKIRLVEEKLQEYVGAAIADIRSFKGTLEKSETVITDGKPNAENNSNIDSTLGVIMSPSILKLRITTPIDKARVEAGKSKFGVLFWEINGYHKLLEGARKSNNRIYSEPFFTSEFGYKLRMYVCLNGVRFGRGSHLATYFQIMKGPNDDTIEWPFFHKHTISLLNQQDESKHKKQVTEPKQTSHEFKHLHYQQPTVGNNFGCGKGSFISHKDVEDGGFLFDDTIYLMCAIE